MKICSSIIFLLLNLSVFAQNSFVENVIDPLQKNHIYFEKVFVHINKTTYFPKDVIWFKAYVGKRNNQPSDMTTRLHLNLLNARGERLFGKNIFIYEGTGKGQIELNGTIDPGTYYLQAYTNYMRNFGDTNYYLQKIKVIGEGGYLLEGTKNVVGIKSLINGKAAGYSGKIVNSRNKEVANFRSQYMGMAKTKFFYEPGEEYKALININDTIIKVEIPTAKKLGIVLNLDNSNKDTLSLQLRTNKSALHKPEDTNYTLLYHQRNKIVGFIQFPKLDSLTALIESDKNIFYNGVNTVTLFKGDQPIAERKFYIEKEDQGIEASFDLVNAQKDSLVYKLSLQKNNKPIQGKFSVSVLSASTGGKEKQNIKSAFLLAPYINGYIKNPAYYFRKENTKRKKHLDLLLLTQSGVRHSLKEMIKDFNPRPQFDFELGFTLKGELAPPFGSNQLTLMSNENQVIDKLFLNGSREFAFRKLLVYKGDTVKVAFLNEQGKAIKPKGIQFDTIVDMSYPIIKIPFKDVEGNKRNISGKTGENELSPDAVKLDEILLTGKGGNERYRRRRELIEKYKHLVFDIGNYYGLRLPESYKAFNNNLLWFLEFGQHVRLKNWKGREYYLTLPRGEAIVYLDGERLVNMDLLRLSSIDMKDVENIMIKPGQHTNIYQIFTTEDFRNNVERLAAEYIMKNGYDRPKKYYLPDNDFNRASNGIILKEVAWKPKVVIENNGEAFITIPKK